MSANPQKDKCIELCEILHGAWSKPLDAQSIKVSAKAYWLVLGEDFDYDEAIDYVREKIIGQAKWAPRPGEILVAVKARKAGDDVPPTAAEAWMDLQERSKAIHDGSLNYAVAHPVLARVMKKLGNDAVGLRTNGDRDMFTQAYEAEVERYLLENYG